MAINKKIQFFTALVVVFSHAFFTHSAAAQSMIKTLNYKIKFNGIPSARAQTEVTLLPSDENSDLVKISWRMKSKPIFHMLFHVNNSYCSILDMRNKKIIRTQKHIDQKNVVHEFNIDYDWNKMTATANNGVSWSIPPGTLDIFSLIYLLQLNALHVDEHCHFHIDFESCIFDVSGRPEESRAVIRANQRLAVLNFQALQPSTSRTWKTDLLTNRLGKSGTVLSILFTPAPDSVPLLIKFTKDNSTVEMQLDN